MFCATRTDFSKLHYVRYFSSALRWRQWRRPT